jgi:hypothetical protein
MLTRILSLMFWVMWLGSFAWGEEGYLDNRSTADELVHSLYNAVNRQEYARAYGYFAAPPAKDYAAYEKGFADTLHVDVMTGSVSSDGAAGSIYFSVPTLIRAKDKKGDTKVFAGCYTVKAIMASAQEPPYRPLLIDKGALKPAGKDDFVLYMLPKCGPEVVDENSDASIDKAKALFVSQQTEHCSRAAETRGGANEPNVYEFAYRDEGASSSDPEQVSTVFEFQCFMGAYNEVRVYYIHDSSNGLALLSFAEPNFNFKYEDEESAKLTSMTLEGFSSTSELINSEVDEKQGEISSFSKWRGIGDASSNGVWKFRKGMFVLSDFEVDPTYNEKMDPITVMKDGKIVYSP